MEKEALFTASQDYLDPKAMDAYLSDFYVRLPVHGYDESITKKVNFPFFTSIDNENKYVFSKLQPYLKNLMNELRDFIFANVTTDFERVDQRINMDSDLLFNYFIEKWLMKQIQISTQKTYFQT